MLRSQECAALAKLKIIPKASLKVLFSLFSSISCDCIESASKPSSPLLSNAHCSIHSFIGKQAGGINYSPLFTLGSNSTDADRADQSLKQIIYIKLKKVKNSIWPEANYLASYRAYLRI